VQGKIELEKHIKAQNNSVSVKKEHNSLAFSQNNLLGIEEIIQRQKKEQL